MNLYLCQTIEYLFRGLSDKINSLTASAPYILIIFSGSMVFFFDFDIDSDGPTVIFDDEFLLRKNFFHHC